MITKIKPLADRVLIKVSEAETTTQSGIIIPDNAKMGIDVLNSEFIEYENVIIASSKGNITRDVDPSSIPYVYNDNYKNNTFYPGYLPKAKIEALLN